MNIQHALSPIKKIFVHTEPQGLTLTEKRLRLYKDHVLERISQTPVGKHPYHHMYIEHIFPDELYEATLRKVSQYKLGNKLQARAQDNPEYVNTGFRLNAAEDAESRYIQLLFEDEDVKSALVKNFYLKPTEDLTNHLRIHYDEFEFTFIEKNRFQNIHVDIPAKFMSMVFYFPETPPTEAEAKLNGTVLYDKELTPCHPAKYAPNSVGIFVPHFYSYHGFSTTIDRQVIVMFYVSDSGFDDWVIARRKDTAPFSDIKDCIERKLLKYPLIEYGEAPERLAAEKAMCRINAPRGRVLDKNNKAPA